MCSGSSTTTRPTARRTASRSTRGSTCDDVPPWRILSSGQPDLGSRENLMSILGTRVVRTEDPRLLTAGGTYTDDLRVPELATAARATFVRSPIAHAMITGIDASAAREAEGVVGVLTVADMDDLPPPPPAPEDGVGGGEGAPLPLGGPWAEPLLAVGRGRFVCEPVAVVLTDERYPGEGAAELGH